MFHVILSNLTDTSIDNIRFSFELLGMLLNECIIISNFSNFPGSFETLNQRVEFKSMTIQFLIRFVKKLSEVVNCEHRSKAVG
jgi:hypothetical protein